MIIVLHAMGGEPSGVLEMFRGYGGRARLIVPFGHPKGNMYAWYESEADAAREGDRLASWISAVVAARPTEGKPVVTGFSQGGIMSFVIATTHPDEISAAVPISGLLPAALYPSAAVRSAKLPPVFAFHGAEDLAVPVSGARASIVELQRVGYSATLREFSGIGHDTSAAELREVFGVFERLASAR
ncbi:MAG: dienelactone hydrolase family protein [Archangium sp.]